MEALGIFLILCATLIGLEAVMVSKCDRSIRRINRKLDRLMRLA